MRWMQFSLAYKAKKTRKMVDIFDFIKIKDNCISTLT